MSVWLTEQEFRQSGAEQLGIAVNRAFLQEIKDEHVQLRDLIQLNRERIPNAQNASMVLEWLQEMLDQVECYFALEEFYGYFQQAATLNPPVSKAANQLHTEHGELFVQLMALINRIEERVYQERECPLDEICAGFLEFADQFNRHEQREMELMMKLCNEEFGVGD